MGNSPYGLTPMTEDFSIEQPVVELDDSDEKRKRSISRTKKWKEFLAFARQRQDSYKQFLPGVNPAVKKSDDNWIVADCIIREYEMLINFIEGS